jgi:2-oxoglutarate ferredoxin oxidoreductase subunit beta
VAFALSRISHGPHGPTPIGIFRKVQRPAYDDLMTQQIADAKEQKGEGNMRDLLRHGGSWVVE